MTTQSQNGKAFEWAVATSIEAISHFPIDDNESAKIARKCYEGISESKRAHFIKMAKAAVAHILLKEATTLKDKKCFIELNSDFKGQCGDVRDLIIKGEGVLIGISCKTNHDALKHPRLSDSIDFIKKWNMCESGCSDEYWSKIKPLFAELRQIKHESEGEALWRDVKDVPTKYYWPILHAFANEIMRAQNSATDAKLFCHRLLTYIIGCTDFYKIIAEKKIVEIQAFNFGGTLVTQKSKLPEKIICIDDVNGGKYSKTIRFSGGYKINFRIHSASSRVEPSLKFDIRATGLPPKNIYIHKIEL